MTVSPRRLLAPVWLAAVLTAAAAARADGAPPAASDRLAAVLLDGGNATTYVGSVSGLPQRRSFPGADRAVLSPDASLVAYTRRTGPAVEIRVAPLSGGADRLLARLRPSEIALAFSPDGARLAYSSAAGISIAAVAGPDRRTLRLPTSSRGSRYAQLAFAPDGRRLLVSRTTGNGRAGTLRNELDAVELSTGHVTTLFRSPNPYDMQARPVSFSPDGAEVATDGTGAIRILPTRGGAGRILVMPPRGGSDHEPLVSPDGRHVAFARSPYRGVSDVYVVGIDGVGLRRVTTTPIPSRGTPKVGTSPLAWSPDATRLLVFRHDRFAIVDVVTRASVDLRAVGVRYAIPSARWFGPAPAPPEAGTIVFERRDDGGAADLYTVRADGSGLRRITSDRLSFEPSWSPDGTRIAFTGGHVLEPQLRLMGADGAEPRQLTRFGPGTRVGEPSWHGGGPTGPQLVFTLHRAGGGGSDLYGIGGDGLTIVRLTDTPEAEASASYSPDGALAYEVAGSIMIREDGRTRRLGEGTEPQWSPDGRRLALLRNSGLHGGTVGVIAADGTGYHALAWGWNPSWSPDGSAIVYGSEGGLFTVRADGVGLPRRLTSTPPLAFDASPDWTAAMP